MITIERYAYTPQGTFGILTFNDFTCYTVERPWDNNTAQVSCIPEGSYTLVRYNSPKFGPVFAVTGGTVSLFPDPNYTRSAVLIHPANVASDLEGCIGLGDSLGYTKSQWAVLNSQVTLKSFMDKTQGLNNISLVISFKTTDTSV